MNAPLRIGIVCYSSPGGSGVIASELAAGLAQRGHHVHVIASEPPSRPLPTSDRLRFHHLVVSDYPVFDHPPYTIAVASAIVEVSREHALDLVHVHYAVPHATSAYLARQVLGSRAPKFITTLHGTDITHVGHAPSYLPITRFAVAASDGITAPSEHLKSEAVRLFDLSEEATAIEVIPNFVDVDRFRPVTPRDPRHFDALFANTGQPTELGVKTYFHVSNLRPVKRPLDLIEVLARVRGASPARLVIVGEGPEQERTKERARSLGLETCVAFLGRRDDFAADLGQADGFWLTSETESFGVAALEAMSAGVPVFAYRVGGLSEVVTEDAGRLIAAYDLDAFARAVIEVGSDAQLQRRLTQGARARAQSKYERSAAVERYEAFFTRVLRRPR